MFDFLISKKVNLPEYDKYLSILREGGDARVQMYNNIIRHGYDPGDFETFSLSGGATASPAPPKTTLPNTDVPMEDAGFDAPGKGVAAPVAPPEERTTQQQNIYTPGGFLVGPRQMPTTQEIAERDLTQTVAPFEAFIPGMERPTGTPVRAVDVDPLIAENFPLPPDQQTLVQEHLGQLSPEQRYRIANQPRYRAAITTDALTKGFQTAAEDQKTLGARVEMAMREGRMDKGFVQQYLTLKNAIAADPENAEEYESQLRELSPQPVTLLDQYSEVTRKAFNLHQAAATAYLKFPEEVKRRQTLQSKNDRVRILPTDTPGERLWKTTRNTVNTVHNRILGAGAGIIKTAFTLKERYADADGGTPATEYTTSDRVIDGITDFVEEFSLAENTAFIGEDESALNFIPAAAGTVVDMAVLLGTTGALGGSRVAMVGSSLAQSLGNSVQRGIEAGLTEDEAFAYGTAVSAVEGLIEAAGTQATTRALYQGGEALRELVKGATGNPTKHIMKNLLKEVGQENGEEILTSIMQKQINAVTNTATGSVMQEDISKDELTETVLLTTAAVLLMGGGGLAYSNHQREALETLAAVDQSKIDPILNQAVADGQLTLKQAEDLQEKIETTRLDQRLKAAYDLIDSDAQQPPAALPAATVAKAAATPAPPADATPTTPEPQPEPTPLPAASSTPADSNPTPLPPATTQPQQDATQEAATDPDVTTEAVTTPEAPPATEVINPPTDAAQPSVTPQETPTAQEVAPEAPVTEPTPQTPAPTNPRKPAKVVTQTGMEDTKPVHSNPSQFTPTTSDQVNTNDYVEYEGERWQVKSVEGDQLALRSLDTGKFRRVGVGEVSPLSPVYGKGSPDAGPVAAQGEMMWNGKPAVYTHEGSKITIVQDGQTTTLLATVRTLGDVQRGRQEFLKEHQKKVKGKVKAELDKLDNC